MITRHTELRIYQKGFVLACELFRTTKSFPREEKYSMTDQIRRSSRSVCTNIAEAWRKRRYKKAFIAKLNDVESEAGETQSWIEFAVNSDYITVDQFLDWTERYDEVIAGVVRMIERADTFVIC